LFRSPWLAQETIIPFSHEFREFLLKALQLN